MWGGDTTQHWKNKSRSRVGGGWVCWSNLILEPTLALIRAQLGFRIQVRAECGNDNKTPSKHAHNKGTGVLVMLTCFVSQCVSVFVRMENLPSIINNTMILNITENNIIVLYKIIQIIIIILHNLVLVTDTKLILITDAKLFLVTDTVLFLFKNTSFHRHWLISLQNYSLVLFIITITFFFLPHKHNHYIFLFKQL